MKKMRDLQWIRRRAASVLRHYGVKQAAVFGSFVRGEANKKSDVDILVEVPSMGLFTFIGLEHALEDKLGRKVDLVTYRSLHPLIRERVLTEQVPIYGKGTQDFR